MPQQTTTLDISAQSIIRIILIILGFVFLYLLRDVLMILFFAIMIASALSPFTQWLERKRIPRIIGVLILYIVFFGLVIFLLSLLIPIASYELNQLTKSLPEFL